MGDFKFQPNHDGTLTLKEAVGQALGAASVCWSDVSAAGTFQSESCSEIVRALVEFIESAPPANRLASCSHCGACILRDMAERHAKFHGRTEIVVVDL